LPLVAAFSKNKSSKWKNKNKIETEKSQKRFFLSPLWQWKKYSFMSITGSQYFWVHLGARKILEANLKK